MCIHWYFSERFSELSYRFSQSPKVVFWTNCAFPSIKHITELILKRLFLRANFKITFY